MKIKNFKKNLLYILAICFSVFMLFFVICCTWIGYEVKEQCQRASRQYDGDCTSSLIALLQDEKQSYRSKNSAIWALGQLGDKRALPILEELYTGNIPDREPLDKTISQYELKKAVNLARGGFNATAFFWRYLGVN